VPARWLYWRLAKDGILAKQEFAPNGVRVLFSMVFPPYQILTKAKFTSLKDFEGLKIRTAGGAKDLAATRVKGVAIRMGAPEVLRSPVAWHDRRDRLAAVRE
jgi:TRAP-type C4-dicarboxylate transport system substrate-binding protein